MARLHLAKIGVELDELSNDQADYIGVPVAGPYKQTITGTKLVNFKNIS